MGSAVNKAKSTATNLFHDAEKLNPLFNPLGLLKNAMPKAPTLPNIPVPGITTPPTPTATETPQTSAIARLRRIQAMRYGFSSTLNTASGAMPTGPAGGKMMLGS